MSGSAPAARAAFRHDIQGLRALAVGAVVVYHVWPGVLPGGYVGVDVFFVISGFLITAHLVDRAARDGRVRLLDFWGRRIRRLLPASFLVLVVSAGLAVTLLPPTVLNDNLRAIAGAGLYVLNWLLARDAVDYLAAENDPTLVQHYWSLSVEEQFYVVWPILVLLTSVLAAALGRIAGADGGRWRRTLLIGVLALVTAGSFVASVALADEPLGYFATFTRAWEFGAGALLAAIGGRAIAALPRPVGVGASWVGLAMIVGACVLFDDRTPFPGAAAALPVVGALLVLVAGPLRGASSPNGWAAARPVQFVGDVSYATYLWHWPIIVVLHYRVSETLSPWLGLAAIALTLVLAELTRRFVEDPVRFSEFWARRVPTVSLLAGGMALVLGLGGGGILLLRAQEAAQRAELEAVAACIGAAPGVGTAECVDLVPEGAVYPSPAGRLADTVGQYACYTQGGPDLTTCRFGATASDVRIALIGDSHASSLLPALIPAAERQGWALDTYVGRGCQLFDGPRPDCASYPAIIDAIRGGDYDLVLVTGARLHVPDVDVVAPAWARLSQVVPLAAIADVPFFPESSDTCVDRAGSDLTRLSSCWTPRAEAFGTYDDPYRIVAEEAGAPVIDLDELVCPDDPCPAIVEHAIVYRDSPASHVTATFARTLSSALEAEVIAALDEVSR